MTPKTAPGRGQIVGLATAVPPIKASVDEVWEALRRARGRRMPKLQSDEGARTRHFAQPLTSLMEPRTQSQQTDAYLEHARVLAPPACCTAPGRRQSHPGPHGVVVGGSCTGRGAPPPG